MKTFRYPAGHEAGATMTVAELRAALEGFPDDMPVLAEWEGVLAYIQPEAFSVEAVSKGHEDDDCECLVIDVNQY